MVSKVVGFHIIKNVDVPGGCFVFVENILVDSDSLAVTVNSVTDVNICMCWHSMFRMKMRKTWG